MIALALNLALSFGHHHFNEAAAHDTAALEASHDTDHSGDDDHHESSVAHPCFACVVLMAAPLAAGPLVLPLGRSALDGVLAATASFDLRDRHRASFEARAPPRS